MHLLYLAPLIGHQRGKNRCYDVNLPRQRANFNTSTALFMNKPSWCPFFLMRGQKARSLKFMGLFLTLSLILRKQKSIVKLLFLHTMYIHFNN